MEKRKRWLNWGWEAGSMAMIMYSTSEGSLVAEPLLFISRILKMNSTRSPAHYTHMNEEKGKTYDIWHEAQGLIMRKTYAYYLVATWCREFTDTIAPTRLWSYYTDYDDNGCIHFVWNKEALDGLSRILGLGPTSQDKTTTQRCFYYKTVYLRWRGHRRHLQ